MTAGRRRLRASRSPCSRSGARAHGRMLRRRSRFHQVRRALDARRVLRAAAGLAAVRQRLRVRPAAGALRLQPAGRQAVLAARRQAARVRPVPPDRRVGDQPGRSGRFRGPVRARRPQRAARGRAGPVRHRRVRPPRRRRQRTRAELPDRTAARPVPRDRRRAGERRPAGDRGRAEQTVRRALRAELGGAAALRRHPERGPRHGCTPRRARRIPAHIPREIIRNVPGHLVCATVSRPRAGPGPGRRRGSGHAIAAGRHHAGGRVPGRAQLVRGLVPGHGQLPAARRFSRGPAPRPRRWRRCRGWSPGRTPSRWPTS